MAVLPLNGPTIFRGLGGASLTVLNATNIGLISGGRMVIHKRLIDR